MLGLLWKKRDNQVACQLQGVPFTLNCPVWMGRVVRSECPSRLGSDLECTRGGVCLEALNQLCTHSTVVCANKVSNAPRLVRDEGYASYTIHRMKYRAHAIPDEILQHNQGSGNWNKDVNSDNSQVVGAHCGVRNRHREGGRGEFSF